MADTCSLEESIGYRRAAALPGVEILDAVNTAMEFRWFHTAFGFGIPTTWKGNITYRGRVQAMHRGMVFCPGPGELSVMPRIHPTGTFHALMCDPQIFSDAVAECREKVGVPRWGVVAKLSPTLRHRTLPLLRAIGTDATPMELQSKFVEFVDAVVDEIVQTPRAHGPEASAREIERVRECIRYDDASLDLDALSRKAGMSRFRVLRAFKRKYGLPPHAYQLSVRIGIARERLKAGKTAADVATELGFADQAHLSRYFKHLVGVTPKAYARRIASA